jgi:hypothetical protein
VEEPVRLEGLIHEEGGSASLDATLREKSFVISLSSLVKKPAPKKGEALLPDRIHLR